MSPILLDLFGIIELEDLVPSEEKQTVWSALLEKCFVASVREIDFSGVRVIIGAGLLTQFEYQKLMNFLDLFYKNDTANNAQILFVLGQDQIEHRHPGTQGWVKAPQFFESCMVVFGDSLTLRQEECLLVLDWHSNASRKVFFLHHNLESVQVLTLPNIEALFSTLVGDAVPHFGPKHEMLTHHVVVHYVFEHRDAIFRVKKIEKNVIISDNLEPDIASDRLNKASSFDQMILHPYELIGIFSFFSAQKQDVGRASGNEHPVVIQVHVAEVLNWSLLETGLPIPIQIDGGDLALAVNCDDLISILVPEALLWEVNVRTIFDENLIF